jgi:chemotaxis protein CheX
MPIIFAETDATAATAVVTLGARLDLGAAQPLADHFRDLLGRPVSVDAGRVTHLGGLCLQVLLSAAAEWRALGQPFRISARTPAFDEAVRRFGLVRADLEAGGAV